MVNAGGGFAAAEDFGPVDIPGGQIGEYPDPSVFVFDPHDACPRQRQGRMAAAARLNGGPLVRGDHVLVGAKAFVRPGAGHTDRDSARLAGELGIPGKDPASVGPGSNGTGGEPAPDGRAADLGHEAAAEDLGSDIGDVQPGERDREGPGQLTRESFDLDHDLGGKDRGTTSAGAFFEACEGESRRLATNPGR